MLVCSFLCYVSDTRALICLCLLVTKHGGQIRDPEIARSSLYSPYTDWSLAVHIHSFIHRRFSRLGRIQELKSWSGMKWGAVQFFPAVVLKSDKTVWEQKGVDGEIFYLKCFNPSYPPPPPPQCLLYSVPSTRPRIIYFSCWLPLRYQVSRNLGNNNKTQLYVYFHSK